MPRVNAPALSPELRPLLGGGGGESGEENGGSGATMSAACACCTPRGRQRGDTARARRRHEAAMAKFTGEDSEWSGTHKPNAVEKALKVKGFQVAMKYEINAARKRDARRDPQAAGGGGGTGYQAGDLRETPSIECRALNRLFRRGRGYQNEKLSTVRQPGIACFAPASDEFILRSEKLTNFAARGFDCWRIPPLPDWPQSAVAAGGPVVAIFYVHGGGFVGGDWAGFRGYCEVLQQRFDGCPIFFPNYRMAPEVSIPDRTSSSQQPSPSV
jgi:hypothetical protein